jgi:putative tricarboxylic transport membrane protein
MIEWNELLQGIHLIANWKIPILIFLGMWIGMIFGVIPGLTGALSIAILLPFTFLLDPLSALVLLTSVYTGGLTGGGITAVLINTPGTPGAVATTFDGYPMTKKGMQNEALGLQVASSVLGGISGYIFLLFFIRPMVVIALEFGPSEMIFLTVFVLVVIGSIGEQSLWRTLMAGFFGLLMGTVGTSEATGVIRGTMGFDELEDGIPAAVCIIGMFAIPEFLQIITRSYIVEAGLQTGHDLSKLIKGVRMALSKVKTLIRSALIGIGMGVLPGIGSTLGCLLSYAQSKRGAKPGQKFGEGEPEGVVAAETANNASEGGAMAILLALGIPGSASTAILVAAFMLHGLVPGPRLLKTHAPLVYGLITANLFQMVFLVFIAIFVAYYMSRVIFIPTRILVPSLVTIMAIGAFSYRNSYFDIYLFFVFGIIGWFMRRHGFSLISFMIGVIMGGRLDVEVYRYVALFDTDLAVFIKRPISAVFLGLIIMSFAMRFYRVVKKGRRKTVNNL